MTINLQAPYNSWLKQHAGSDVTEASVFSVKLGSKTKDGLKDVVVDLDLIWFVLIYVDDTIDMKLQVVKELLKDPILLAKFKATLDKQEVKRIISEFLLFNYACLDALKQYIDFAKLNVPVDFITHALFITRSEGKDSPAISKDRLKIVNTVLDCGFLAPANNDGSVLRKVLLMEDVPEKFIEAKRLLAAGFKLFSKNLQNNSEVAITLLNNRGYDDCKEIIEQHALEFKNVTMHVPGSGEDSNLADYYYWVKEDMDTVHYIKTVLGIVLKPT